MSGELGSGTVLPSVYSHLPDKTEVSYSRLFGEIKEKVGDYEPDRAYLDLELAAINAFKALFPSTMIELCYFHIRKALREQMRERKILDEFNESEEFQGAFYSMLAIIFVPVEDIIAVWTDVIVPIFQDLLSHVSEEADQFFAYFERTYIGAPANGGRKRPRFAHQYWNHYLTIMDDKRLTNNVVEGWNAIWNNNSVVNGTLWSSIDHMRKEDSTATAKWREDLTTRSQTNSPIEETRGGRKIAQKEKMLRFRNVCKTYSSITDKLEYIKLIKAVI